MKTKLLKKLRNIGRHRVSINSVTRTTTWRGEFVTGMSIIYSLSQYSNIWDFGMTEEDVYKKAMEIFFETEMDWVRTKYKKYTRKYRYGRNKSSLCRRMRIS